MWRVTWGRREFQNNIRTRERFSSEGERGHQPLLNVHTNGPFEVQRGTYAPLAFEPFFNLCILHLPHNPLPEGKGSKKGRPRLITVSRP